MNKTVPETREFFKELVSLAEDATDVDIVVAPPFTSLSAAAESVKGTNIKIAAQDVFYEEKGAFTGEISPAMILD
ncbi:MAG: triose-phosphate isomerase, partial [Nitrospirota bacterium]